MRRYLRYVLIGFVSALVIGSYLKWSNSNTKSPMTGDEFTRTSTQVPDVQNTKDGWVHDLQFDLVQPDKFGGQFLKEDYFNERKNLVVFLIVRKDKNGVRQELFMDYGGPNVGRSAIKVAGKWHIGREPFSEKGVEKKEFTVKGDSLKDVSENVIGMKFSLETLDGPKELVVNMVEK